MASFTLKSGTQLAYQQFKPASASFVKNALCFHGWLDNSATFSKLGPALCASGVQSTAIDFIGHGWSSHAAPSSVDHFLAKVMHGREVFDIMREESILQEGEKITLIGHSMGGSVALLFAAAYPELVDRLVLLESFGPVVRRAEESVTVLRKAVDAQLANEYKPRKKRTYTLESATEARVRTAQSWPGNQSISVEAAACLVQRGLEPVQGGEGDGSDMQFRHDNRLYLPSPSYFTPDQVSSFFDAISCKTLLVTGTEGWPVSPSLAAKNKAILENKGLLTHVTLDGSHHLHLDPETAPAVIDAVQNFLVGED